MAYVLLDEVGAELSETYRFGANIAYTLDETNAQYKCYFRPYIKKVKDSGYTIGRINSKIAIYNSKTNTPIKNVTSNGSASWYGNSSVSNNTAKYLVYENNSTEVNIPFNLPYNASTGVAGLKLYFTATGAITTSDGLNWQRSYPSAAYNRLANNATFSNECNLPTVEVADGPLFRWNNNWYKTQAYFRWNDNWYKATPYVRWNDNWYKLGGG